MNPLDSINRIKECDRSGMLEIIESFPEQCLDAKRIGDEFELPEGFKTKYKNIACIGMGGSAIGADLVRSYIADKAEVPLFVIRSYALPDFVDDGTLVIASSYSGNTEETLSAYDEAVKRGCGIIAITSGGKLLELAKDDNAGIINIPAGLPPRAALGYSAFSILILLSKTGIIKDQSFFIDDAIRNLRKLKKLNFGHKIKSKDNQAKKIAKQIYGKMPVVYAACDRVDAVVTRWHGQLAENSKTLSLRNVFPEMTHNEIEGWENPPAILENSVVIMLEDAADDRRVLKRMAVVKKILKKSGIDVIEIRSTGNELLGRIFSLVYMADFVSFYLAMLNRIDPSPVARIAYLKRELSK
ncbi:MAG: bifunctional phosphoglucose/phosphomannose isomerase [Candidatus Omnitrophota bacterium]